MKFFILIILIAIFPISLFGYLDPGSGSILLYFIMGLFATLIYSIKNLIFRIKNTFLRMFSKHKINLKKKKNIVFYSEGGHYYECFRPVMEKLTKMKIDFSYYTSDIKDKGLEYKSEYCDSLFIGESKLAMMSLNYLNAKILVMTTPQIEVMYLKKSKNVDYFVHIVHMSTDIFKIVPFSFDFFDCVMCSGQHQIDSIRLLEQTRALPPKNLLKTGLTYFDGLIKNKGDKKETDKITILIAPTWGKFGLLNKVGFKILDILLKTDCNIIIRPNPQSFISDLDTMKEIEKKSKQYKQIEIDRRASPSYAMNFADIMISDMSGVIFDFAFVHEKPIIVFNKITDEDSFTELKIIRDYHKISKQIWELDIMDQVATVIELDELSNLPNIINKKLHLENKDINNLRDKSIFHYGNAGNTCAKQLADLLEGEVK